MRCSSVGWPARLNSSIDCSVGVTESLAACSSSSGRGAMRPTTSSARKSNMLCAVSAGNDWMELLARLLRRCGGIGRGMLGEEGERVARVLDLLQADHAAEFALAVAAAAHVEAQHNVTQVAEHLGGLHGVRGGLVAAETVQHEEGAAPLGRPQSARDVHHARELETGGGDGNGFFGHRRGLRWGRDRDCIGTAPGWKMDCRTSGEPMKASSLRRQMQQRMDAIAEHVEIAGDKGEP